MPDATENILGALSPNEIVIRLLVSLFIGIIIGLEREIHLKSAGLRTSVLICLGATIFSIASIEFNSMTGLADPSRIAAQIVTGIGFLGAGAIIQTRGSVHGLTTAATIWVMASLGLAVGLGMFVLGIGGAILTLVVLIAFQWIEYLVKGKKTSAYYTVLVTRTGPALNCITEAIRKSPGEVKALKVVRKGEMHQLKFSYTDRDDKHTGLIDELSNMDGVEEVDTGQNG